jgi:GntR family transcriptional regulator of vanillate catabolism
MVCRGELRGGDRLREEELAASLHVSRTPIRLALERLCAAGWLSALPLRGFEVPEFTLESVLAAIEVRVVLEGTAARLAAERMAPPEILRRLHHCVDEMACSAYPGDSQRYSDIDAAFHKDIVELAHNATLRRAISQCDSSDDIRETGSVV